MHLPCHLFTPLSHQEDRTQFSLLIKPRKLWNRMCLQQPPPTDSLPTASVVLCFHDEAWSTLLRTVHSILDTAPRAFLKEIVLVDDLSQQGNSGVSQGSDAFLVKGKNSARSPVVPGGVVAMDRHYFQNTGAYDPLLSLQGGENLELSLKNSQIRKLYSILRTSVILHSTWLCGGSVEILPCSRVGHLYRNEDAHSQREREATLQNKVRIAETWLGSFKETFYRHSPEALSLSKAGKPDCMERQQLQRRLGCRTFHWFLANVYPELYPLERRPRFSGKARHERDKGQRRRKWGRVASAARAWVQRLSHRPGHPGPAQRGLPAGDGWAGP
ncbi:GALNT15 [Cervus elaphus hippelaphus]|uniref:GALNT15 n=1 Tax=Cervus elaphus hippelaphus TaxID=46360 RepID=A0A212CI31_CEREH|nr:GALNT15 [Cervus elaphus hippelaphus]